MKGKGQSMKSLDAHVKVGGAATNKKDMVSVRKKASQGTASEGSVE